LTMALDCMPIPALLSFRRGLSAPETVKPDSQPFFDAKNGCIAQQKMSTQLTAPFNPLVLAPTI
ncbi:MAG: hypothetical protein ACRAUZ_14935, partial [Aeromonas jandaei]